MRIRQCTDRHTEKEYALPSYLFMYPVAYEEFRNHLVDKQDVEYGYDLCNSLGQGESVQERVPAWEWTGTAVNKNTLA